MDKTCRSGSLFRGGVLLFFLVLSGCASLTQTLKNQTCSLDWNHPYDVLAVDLERYDLRLFWKDPQGRPFLTIDRLRAYVAARGDSLVAATNAGIYEPGYVPTGLYVEGGRVAQPLNLDDGAGNFYLKPNGVFFITDAGAHIVESSAYDNVPYGVHYATQSGPLLVHHGEIHPAFTAGSDNCRLRSGVGIATDGTVYLAISNGGVNFYDFATFFRDTLHCPDALYLDGTISTLYAPSLNRGADSGKQYAGILAVLLKAR